VGLIFKICITFEQNQKSAQENKKIVKMKTKQEID